MLVPGAGMFSASMRGNSRYTYVMFPSPADKRAACRCCDYRSGQRGVRSCAHLQSQTLAPTLKRLSQVTYLRALRQRAPKASAGRSKFGLFDHRLHCRRWEMFTLSLVASTSVGQEEVDRQLFVSTELQNMPELPGLAVEGRVRERKLCDHT